MMNILAAVHSAYFSFAVIMSKINSTDHSCIFLLQLLRVYMKQPMLALNQ